MDEVNCNTEKICFFSDVFIACGCHRSSSYNMYMHLFSNHDRDSNKNIKKAIILLIGLILIN